MIAFCSFAKAMECTVNSVRNKVDSINVDCEPGEICAHSGHPWINSGYCVTNFYVGDGCDSQGASYTGNYYPHSAALPVRCCSMDGTTCTTPGTCEDFKKDRYDLQKSATICADLGRRLCTKNELSTGVCCSSGGGCDGYGVWTSTPEPEYRTPQQDGACAIEGTQYAGTIYSGVSFHEACACDTTPVSECKSHCDDDDNCKGYSEKLEMPDEDRLPFCQIATTSNCPTNCKKYYQGNNGTLVPDSDLFGQGSYPHKGCYIKL